MQAARWLCFADASLPGALGHANDLARELALGLAAAAAPSAVAGWALLHEVGSWSVSVYHSRVKTILRR